jgi:ankyrin repeat protein
MARRPLERERICLDGGRRTTQLMRDSLGGTVSSIPPQLFDELVDAAERDRSRARTLLQEHPEILSARGRFGETPLHFLAVEGFAEAVQFLAEAGADVNLPNDMGESPLLDVAALGNADVAAVLLRFGADPNAQSDTRDNVLHEAVQSGNARLVEILLEAGANGRYRTELDETVFDALPEDHDKRAEILRVLAEQGISNGAA